MKGTISVSRLCIQSSYVAFLLKYEVKRAQHTPGVGLYKVINVSIFERK